MDYKSNTMTFLPQQEPQGIDTPFYRDFRYTDLIKTELDNFRYTKTTVRKFIGDNVPAYILQHEIEKFAASRRVKTDEVSLEAKGSPFFDEDDGPGIMLRAEVYPTQDQVDQYAKQRILELKRKVENLMEQKQQLDKIPEWTRNLLLELTYIG